MSAPDIDVLCVGNAIVDVLAYADEAFLDEHELPKGTMRLVDGDEAAALYKDLPPGIEASGGSAANTAVGVASLGGRAAFIGRVNNDQLGAVFTHDIRNAGVAFDTPPVLDGPPTAQCLVVVTPDAQRTLSTFLGASQLLHASDIDVAVVNRSAVTYLEGYLWDPPEAKDAFRAAMDAAGAAGRRVAFSLTTRSASTVTATSSWICCPVRSTCSSRTRPRRARCSRLTRSVPPCGSSRTCAS